MKRFAFSLTELLVAVAIVALVAALLLPVVVSTQAKSKEVPCISNLKQLFTSWTLYAEQHSDSIPKFIDNLVASGGIPAPVWKCPTDGGSGANVEKSKKLKFTISYFYLNALEEFRQAMASADANHGIFYCVTHGRRVEFLSDYVLVRDTSGLVLRLRRDGSIQHAKVGHWCGPITPHGRIRGRQEWSLLSDTKCVEPFCFGLTEPCD